MSEAIITVENLGKRYRLGARSNERYTALRDVITDKAKSLFHRPNNRITDNGSLASSRDFWALRDISFKVKRGLWLGFLPIGQYSPAGEAYGSESEVVASCQEGDTARRGIIGVGASLSAVKSRLALAAFFRTFTP